MDVDLDVSEVAAAVPAAVDAAVAVAAAADPEDGSTVPDLGAGIAPFRCNNGGAKTPSSTAISTGCPHRSSESIASLAAGQSPAS